jgi:hypothetical protein
MSFTNALQERPLMKLIRILMVGLIALASVSVASPAGAATGGQQGVLLIHGAGSVFSGSGSVITTVGNPGTTDSFTIEVLNTGTTASQYELTSTSASNINCGAMTPCTSPSYTVLAGTTDITPLTSGSERYYTALIQPGKAATYTLKIPVASGTAPDSMLFATLYLDDLAGNALANVTGVAATKSTTGTSALDQFLSAPGQSTVSAPTSSPWATAPILAAPAVKAGQTVTFSGKLQNDSASPASMAYTFYPPRAPCSNHFSERITEKPSGLTATATDITAAATSQNGWTTPVLAHGASIAITISINYFGGGDADCLSPGWTTSAIFVSATGNPSSGPWGIGMFVDFAQGS